MYSFIVTFLGLVIFVYMFDVLRKRSSVRAKRIGLVFWLAAGSLVTFYALLSFSVWDGGVGFVIVFLMGLFFWVLPTGGLLYLDSKQKLKNEDNLERLQ